MRPRISIRGSVRPSVRPSVCRSVGNEFFSNPRKRVLTAEMDEIKFMIQGKPVPNPTPIDSFVPFHVRRRFENEWPMVGARVSAESHGWRW